MKRWVEGKGGELEHQGRNENWSGSMTSSREGCRGAGPLPVATAQSRLGREVKGMGRFVHCGPEFQGTQRR